MILGRILGWLLIVGAVLVAAHDAYDWRVHGADHMTAADALWRRISSASMDWAEREVARHIAPAFWNRAIVPTLRLPAWSVLGVPGILLAILFRRRRYRSARRFG